MLLKSLFDFKSKYLNDDDAFGMGHHFGRREESITKFIEASVEAFEFRVNTKNVFQIIISSILLLAMLSFAATFVFVIFYATLKNIYDVSILVSLIGSASAFVSSLFALLTIVVKYIFPKYDDEHSMELLKMAIATDKIYFDKNEEQKEKMRDRDEKNNG